MEVGCTLHRRLGVSIIRMHARCYALAALELLGSKLETAPDKWVLFRT